MGKMWGKWSGGFFFGKEDPQLALPRSGLKLHVPTARFWIFGTLQGPSVWWGSLRNRGVGSPGGCLSVQLLSRCWLAQTYLFNSKLAEQIILFLPSSRQRTRPVWKSISACTVEVFHAARQDPHTAGVRGYEDRVTRVGSVSKLKLCRTGCQVGVFVPLNVQFNI